MAVSHSRPPSWISGILAQQQHTTEVGEARKEVQRTSKHEWFNPLLPTLANCQDHLSATFCPCVWVYFSANAMLTENNSSPDTLSVCYAGLLSALICAPSLFCIDRSATHTLNGMLDRHNMVPAHEGDLHHHRSTMKHGAASKNNDAASESESEDDDDTHNQSDSKKIADLWMHFLSMTGFGQKNAEQQRASSWTSDGRGFDIDDWSEDYWAAGWCSYYTYRSFCCNFLRCRTCNNAPYAPMCFVFLCGALYPLCICPSALVLRRGVVGTRTISETFFDSTIRALLCAPCSLVQTYREIQTIPATTTTATVFKNANNSMIMMP